MFQKPFSTKFIIKNGNIFSKIKLDKFSKVGYNIIRKREEVPKKIKSPKGGRKMINLECPANDWMCPYFDNGRCTLETAKVDCEFMAEEEDE